MNELIQYLRVLRYNNDPNNWSYESSKIVEIGVFKSPFHN